jgi:hypothetical protein
MRWPALVALALLALFLFTGLRNLDRVPQVYEDEPWQASTAYKLETQGVFGSDLFAGFDHMDQRYYGFMPLHPLLLALDLKLLGPGLAQARLETVVLTAITLTLTFALGARLFNAWVGTLAVGILVLVRWSGLTYIQLTGIPVVDFARIARYDPLVPVIGLAALHVYLSARSRRLSWLYLLAGVLAGLAGLAHVYGLFWVPALLLLALWDRHLRATPWILAGALLAWQPYAVYVAGDIPDWRGQTAVYASRFGLLDPRWYLANLIQEYHRYGPGLGPIGLGWLWRPGFWCLLVALPLSLIALGRRAFACDAAARAVVLPAVLFPVLFALLITLKLVNYTLIELPLFAVAIAWGVYTIGLRRPRLRPVFAILGAAVLLEGSLALSELERSAPSMTPYPVFVAEVRQFVPAGSRVLGLHSYWLGMQDFNYRSFLVPLNLADAGLPVDQALDQVDPDVVLLDTRMRAYFESLPPGGDGERFAAWLDRHAAQLLGRVDDPTYGLMEIYRVNR